MSSVRSADRHASGLDWGLVPRWSPCRGRTFFRDLYSCEQSCRGHTSRRPPSASPQDGAFFAARS